MVRVGALWDQASSEGELVDLSGKTPREQLEAISERSETLMKDIHVCYEKLLSEFKETGIELLTYTRLSPDERLMMTERFYEKIYPALTFRVLDQGYAFPLVKNLTQNFLVSMKDFDGNHFYGHVQVPQQIHRLVRVGPEGSHRYLLLEEVLEAMLPDLFQDYEMMETLLFRVVRNAGLYYEEEDDGDLLKKIEQSVKKRNVGQIVRVDLRDKPSKRMFAFILKAMVISSREVYVTGNSLDPSYLDELVSKKWFNKYLPIQSSGKDVLVTRDEMDVWKVIREQDRFCHVPYDDFTSVVELIRNAADDPKVLSIRQTLYRVSKNSPILLALEQAARSGKNVTVLLEVKARFDEENNIAWAKRLEQAGVQIIHTPLKLKTHAKLLLVLRKEKDAPNGYRTYSHISTGNYNEKTATGYEDIGIFTANREIGHDIIEVFNFLSSGKKPQELHHLVMSPEDSRSTIKNLIRFESEQARLGKNSRIRLKVNSLIDKETIDQLYEAAALGVPIDLIVRGICGIVPMNNIRVRSIVGRLLEHSRIYHFHHGGEDRVYIGSMDLMERNFDRRVEILCPLLDPVVKAQGLKVLDACYKDNVNSYELQGDGNYTRVSGMPSFDLHGTHGWEWE